MAASALPDGKVALIEPDWVGKLAGFTLLFEALVLLLAQQMPFAAVARIVGEGWRHIDGSSCDVVGVGLVGAQILGEAGDGQSIAPFGNEYDLASVGIGSEGEIGVAAPIGGLVNGHACERREVGPG